MWNDSDNLLFKKIWLHFDISLKFRSAVIILIFFDKCIEVVEHIRKQFRSDLKIIQLGPLAQLAERQSYELEGRRFNPDVDYL